MVKVKKDPVDQKAKLVEQLKEIEQKIADFDEQRASKVATLAKKYRIVDINDDILNAEFKALRDKHLNTQDVARSAMDAGQKKS